MTGSCGLCPPLEIRGPEILVADGVPVVPATCPVVILRGSSCELGTRHAPQPVPVFGPRMLQSKAGRVCSAEALALLRE